MNFIFSIFSNKKIFKILTSKDKIIFLRILIVMFIGACLELMGIGLVIPVISTVADYEPSSNYLIVKNFIASIFGFFLIELNITSLLIFVIIFFLFKAIFLTNLAYIQGKFVYELESSISKKIFKNYLNQPYLFFVKNNSSKLIQNAVNEPMLFNGYAVQPFMLLITELTVLMGIVFLLFAIQPAETTFIATILAIFAILFLKFFKKRIETWGILRQQNTTKIIKYIQQGVSAIKEVKVFGKEIFFLDKYKIYVDEVKNSNIKATVAVQLPKLWLDFLAVLLILSVLIYSINFQNIKSINEILPMAALYLAASFRIIPSINRSLHASQQITYAKAAVDRIFEELNLKDEIRFKNTTKIKLQKKICINNLTFSYDGNREIIKNANFEIEKGDFVSITGQSGSGKTTLVNLIIGLIKPNYGTIEVDGINIHENINDWWNQVGYISQNIYLLDDTILANIAFGENEKNVDIKKAWNVLKICALEDLINNLPNGIMTNVGERGLKLSGGQIQRLGIARCLYVGSNILFLDEATNALDPGTEKEIIHTIEKLRGDVTIFNIAHRPAVVKNYNRNFKVLNNGIVQEE